MNAIVTAPKLFLQRVDLSHHKHNGSLCYSLSHLSFVLLRIRTELYLEEQEERERQKEKVALTNCCQL